MENLTYLQPQNVLDALKQGKKMAIFAINEQEKPTEKISDIIFPFSPLSAFLSRSESLIEPALKYIKNNFNRDIKLEYLSELCQISPNYFCSLFSKTCHMSFTSYIRDLRLKQACYLLKTTAQTVVSIAVETGYADSGYFNKLFKKKYGCTPAQYRKFLVPVG